MFMFGGRRANVELQLPFVHRILDEHPNVEYHIWDLARDPQDSEYLRTLTGDRISVCTQFAGPKPWAGFNRVWNYYTSRRYKDCMFVKLDDDVVYLDTDRFGDFLQASKDNPDHVVSALTINNGATTPLIPELWDGYQSLNIPLLDVHMSAEYAEMCHRWFFTNWNTTRPNTLHETNDWVSINCIAYTWAMGRQIASLLGTRPPRRIAGRSFTPQNRVGDEGSVNMFPRLIHEGFTAAHLYFGPQAKVMSDDLLTELRKQYADIARQHLT
ncbi:glycosyltransferase [Mycobacterium phage Cornie]|uniref:Glycosyltransferase n=1 Tax=Mycobacterium phage Cornie TaxID=2704043 RepID=A0A6G6XKD2_9CAUD|nr:glycosyltransferase [Mycobacterium phage Cornie]QIG58474.1 glycosyltransferase [Mycobacterium phage Cornie]